MTTNEQSWAVELQRARHAAKRRTETPIAMQKKQNQDIMNYAKAELLKALREKNTAVISNTLGKLFKLRAEQTAIQLAEIKELYGYLEPAAIEAEIGKYYLDCVGLQRTLAPHGA